MVEKIFDLIKLPLYFIFTYLGIGTDVVKVLFLLMMLDSIIGIIVSLRLGESFSFKVLGWGMVQKLILLLIPMTLALIAKGLSFDFKYFVIAAMDIIIVSEGISIFRNILSYRKRERIESTDYITMLLSVIKDYFSRLILKFLSLIEQKKG